MRLRFLVWFAMSAACLGCGSPRQSPTHAPAPAPTEPAPAPTASQPPPSGTCAGPAPGPGYECLQDCGPPVAQQGDPAPGFSWLSAKDAQSRKQFGCPICLGAETLIATPDGARPVSVLRVGDAIWTLDQQGRRIAGRVLHAGSTPVGGRHSLVRVTLADGRKVGASPGHPTLDGRALGTLRAGDALAGSVVTQAERAPFDGERTFDVLPSGPTGAYWADGVVLGSSFRR